MLRCFRLAAHTNRCAEIHERCVRDMTPKYPSIELRKCVLLALTAVIYSVSTSAIAGAIVVIRDVPHRSAVHTAPPGPATEVDTSPKDMVLALVPNGKELSDDQVASVFAQVNDPQRGLGGPNLNPVDFVEDANSRAGLTGSPDGGLSSVSRLGSSISGTVNSNINSSVGQLAPTIQSAVPGTAPGG